MRAGARIGVGLLAVLWLGCASMFDASTPAGATMASNRFGLDLYGRVKADGENLICSPASASFALAMASAGARGETAVEMTRVLHIDATKAAETHHSFGRLLGVLNGRNGKDGLMLSVADRVWAQDGLAFESDFLATLHDRYRAPLEKVDFEGANEAARLAINHWAAEATHGRIPEIIGPGELERATRLVLTNAIYFKGAWVKPFDPRVTLEKPFASPAGEARVKMMAQTDTFAYARAGGVQILELPYRGGLSMIVLLPDATDGLPGLERRIGGSYDGWLAALRPALVELELPRWTFTSRMYLNGPLAALGMQRAFTKNAADFSGMTRDAALLIDKVIQEAFVEVNETGTEAAAVTAVEMMLESARMPEPTPIPFHADHPFMFLIRDTATGAILFVGRVAAPGA
jgi:serpin B